MTDKQFLLWLYQRQITVHGDDPGTDYLVRFLNYINTLPMKSKIYCLTGADIISRIQLRRHGLDVATVDRIAGREFEVRQIRGGDVLISEGGKSHWLPLDAVTIL